jgi:hypothetical protein
MFLNYATYFGVKEGDLKSVVDFLITEHMEGGGFNCYSNRRIGAKRFARSSARRKRFSYTTGYFDPIVLGESWIRRC